MNRPLIAVFLSAFVLAASFTTTSHGQDKPRKGFLSILKEGQSVSVKDVGGRYEIIVMKDVKLGQKVIEVGSDYLVVEDAAGVTEIRIPVYSIRSIVRLKLPKD